MKRLTKGEIIFRVCNVLILTLLSLLFLYPVWYVIISSISNPALIRGYNGILLFPKGFTLSGYRMVIRNPSIWLGYKNTVIYVISGVAISMVLTVQGGYALSRPHCMLKKPVMIFIIITMFFSGGLVPSYLLVQRLGIMNTRWAIILPSALSSYNMIVMRTSFQSIPNEMIESAKIDGANDIRILISIVLPVSKSMLAVIGLFYGVAMWNSWFSASIFLQNRSLFPLQIILQEILIKNSSMAASQVGEAVLRGMNQDDYYVRTLVQYCTIIVSCFPILCAYPFLQKYFIKGVMIGSLKG